MKSAASNVMPARTLPLDRSARPGRVALSDIRDRADRAVGALLGGERRPTLELGSGAGGPLEQHQRVVREEVEDEGAQMDLILKWGRARLVFVCDGAADGEDRVRVGLDLGKRSFELLPAAVVAEQNAEERFALEVSAAWWGGEPGLKRLLALRGDRVRGAGAPAGVAALGAGVALVYEAFGLVVDAALGARPEEAHVAA